MNNEDFLRRFDAHENFTKGEIKEMCWGKVGKVLEKNIVDTKEIQLSVNISKHDMETKAKHAKEFLSKGEKVRVVLIMRGRELTRREESSKSFYEFLSLMGDEISYDSVPRNEGNKIITVLKKKK